MAVTGQIAGGANLLCFTTGRGSAFGAKPTPCLKLSTNNALWQRQRDDMDLNCGTIVDGEETIEQVENVFIRELLSWLQVIVVEVKSWVMGARNSFHWIMNSIM